jgi:uncharacterized membrane-anchored protein
MMSSYQPAPRSTSTARVALTKVPEITAIFWVLKLLTTGMGESMSDFLGQHSVPIAGAMLIVFIALVAYVAVTKVDVQSARHSTEHPHLHLEPRPELAPEFD